MDTDGLNKLVEDKVQECIRGNNADLLRSIEGMVAKISAPSVTHVVTAVETPTFKRRSNEEQYKQNAKILDKLTVVADNLTSGNIPDAKEAVLEAKDLVRKRQKLIQLADTSELGWRTVAEYEMNPIASDSDDEKRMYRAESRASRKAKADRGRRRGRIGPYRRRASYTASQAPAAPGAMQQGAQGQRQRPGMCFICGKPGHWKRECPQSSYANNKISIMYFPANVETLSINCMNEGFVGSRGTEVSDGGTHILESVSHGKVKEVCSPGVERKDVSTHTTVRSSIQPCKAGTSNEMLTENGHNESPAGRLKQFVGKWEDDIDNKYIIDVVKNGYKLPFKKVPPNVQLANNKSARDNSEFVSKEIKSLLAKGVISEVTTEPAVVNPLTVAFNKAGKARLVLDCRHINPFLHLFKVKFEDIYVAESMFDLSSYVYTFDLRSAYFHIDIYNEHSTYLGFSWTENEIQKFYVFNSLPFGIATAGHIFTKTMRCIVKLWRSSGHRVIMFLDDGIGGDVDCNRAEESSRFVRKSLCEFGFIIAEDKCCWTPNRVATWLGHIIDFESNQIFITGERIARLEIALDSIMFQLQRSKLDIIPVRFLSSVIGQVISTQSVLGKTVCRKTRYLHKCVNTRIGWNSYVKVSNEAKQELNFWRNNIRKLNGQGKSLTVCMTVDACVYSDASGSGYGGYVSIQEADRNLPGQVEADCRCVQSSMLPEASDSLTVLPEGSSHLTRLQEMSRDMNVLSQKGNKYTWIPEVGQGMSRLPEVSCNLNMFLQKGDNYVGLPEVSQDNTRLPEVSCDLTGLSDEGKGLIGLPEVSPDQDGFPEVNRSCFELHNMVGSSTTEIQELICNKSELPEVSNSMTHVSEVNENFTGTSASQVNNMKIKRTFQGNTISSGTEVHGPWTETEAGVGLRESLKRKLDEAGPAVADCDRVVDRMATHILVSRADSTVTKYSYQVKQFNDFCAKNGISSNPAHSVHVAMYLSHMIDSGKSDSVVTSAFYAIKWLHDINGHTDPTCSSIVKNMLECAKRCNSKPVKKKDVISSEHLIDLCNMYIRSEDVITLRDLSMILLCYSGFLRYNELSELRCCDVKFKGDHLVLQIRKSKTDVYRAGNEVLIAKGSTSACPISMLERYLLCSKLDRDSESYLFKPACRSGSKCFLISKNKKLSYTRARECIVGKLRSVAPHLNLGTHSLRASGATTAANADGVSDRCLKRHGRWKTDMAKDGYIDDSIEKKLIITKKLNL